jgi:hypothetical protein
MQRGDIEPLRQKSMRSAAARSISLLLLAAASAAAARGSSPGRSAAEREKSGRLRDASGFATRLRPRSQFSGKASQLVASAAAAGPGGAGR